jgi:hypothetical protein
MKTNLAIAFILSAGLMACGGKAKKATTPTGTDTEMKANGSAMGGSTYGGAMTPAGGSAAPMSSGGADPCAPGK